MSNHQQKLSPAAKISQTTPSSVPQTNEVEPLQLQRFFQNPTASPQLMRAAQKYIGNQALQRLVRQAQTPEPTLVEQKMPSSIQRLTQIQQRTGHGVMQRGFFSWIIKKLAGTKIKNQATEATFGTDAERQASPEQKIGDVEAKNKESFSKIDQVDVPSGPNGEHKLNGRHYLAKDATKGPYAGKTILFLSGSGGGAEDYSRESAIYYCKNGANLLAVNYRGFGRSTTTDVKGVKRKMGHNELTDTMLYEDSRAMFDWLTRAGVEANQVIVHGYSLGGAMAANLVSALADGGIRVAGLVFHSAIDSARKVAVRSAGSFLGNIGADKLGSDFDTVGAMKKLATQHPEMLDMPIAAFSGAQDKGDHLDDKTTNLSGQMTDMGFENVDSKSHQDRSHTPDHLTKNPSIGDMVKKQLGVLPPIEAPKKKEEQIEAEVVKI